MQQGPTSRRGQRRAEDHGFAYVATIDRIAYPSYDSLLSLAVAAFAAMERPFDRRGALMDQTLDLMQRSWAGEGVAGGDRTWPRR